MRGLWLFLIGAILGIAGTAWFLHRSALPDVFDSLRSPAAAQTISSDAHPPVASEPASTNEIVEPNCEPFPLPAGTAPAPWVATGATPAASVPATPAREPDAAPEPDTAVATEPVPPPTAEQLASPPAEVTTAAPAPATAATAPETPAEKAVTSEPVAPEPAPPTEPETEQSAVPTPIADSYQAHPDALVVPVTGVMPDQLSDTFDDLRGPDRKHEAMDIMAPKGTPVVAVDDGKVVKLFNSVRGGLTVYQFDPSEKIAYYYAHLDSYAPGVEEGKVLKRGDLIGHVGVTGNSNPDAPHLHFAVFELGAEKQWWRGTAINPYPLFKR